MKCPAVERIPLASIIVGERFRKQYGNMDDLIASIKEQGLIQPIAVAKSRKDGEYILLAGGRRLRACTTLGFAEMPARIYPDDISEEERRAIELTENIQRLDMTWPEELALKEEIHTLQQKIHGIARKGIKDGWSQADTAKMLGESQPTLNRDLALARVLKTMPQLKNLATKAEAMKVAEKLLKRTTSDVVAKKVLQQRAETPEAKLRENIFKSYVLTDVFEGMKQIPDGSIKFIECDPPYGIDLGSVKKSASGKSIDAGAYTEVAEADYPGFISKVISECARILHPDGWLVIWYGANWQSLIRDLLRKHKLLTSEIPAIWVKPAGQTQQPNLYLASAYESFIYARKTNNACLASPGRRNVFQYNPVAPQRKIHPTERPIELMTDIISTFVGKESNVLVPFAGSGATLLAAANLGMRAIGFDIDIDYRNAFIVRVNDALPGKYMSYVKENKSKNAT